MSELIWLIGVLAIPVVLILLFRRLHREDPGSRRKRRYVDLDED